MTYLDSAAALTHAGSLISRDGEIVASYDLEVSDAEADGYRPLSMVTSIRNAHVRPFRIDYSHLTRVHVINGMGVTLGDSVIGLTALSAIKKRHPGLQFALYRPNQTPVYVKQLYELAAPVFGKTLDLPVLIETLPDDELALDLGNHLFWPNFSSMPMIDFFLSALGIEPDDVDPRDKSNDWLRQVEVPALRGDWAPNEYVLLCPTASTPVRSIPRAFRAEVVNRLWARFQLPVLGFGEIDHPGYRDVTALSPDTAAFVAWVKNARFVVTSDTAAVHIAAGFDVPTAAFFTTVPSDLRVRDYRHCTAIDLHLQGLCGVQASSRPKDIALLERAYEALDADKWPMLALRTGLGAAHPRTSYGSGVDRR